MEMSAFLQASAADPRSLCSHPLKSFFAIKGWQEASTGVKVRTVARMLCVCVWGMCLSSLLCLSEDYLTGAGWCGACSPMCLMPR
jgi:hypothetical protein